MLNSSALQHAGCGISFLHEMAESLGRAIDARDPHTALHSEQVADISLLIARAMGLSGQECLMIHIAGHLHDIGKIGIPDTVLLKQAPLSDRERCLMMRHPEIGAQIVAPVALCASPGGIADMIRHHHERYDGSGYPQALSGKRIPLGSRIIAVADTYSALLQDRPYRRGTSHENGLEEICACAGSQFDPEVVAVFCGCDRSIMIPGQPLERVSTRNGSSCHGIQVKGFIADQYQQKSVKKAEGGLPVAF